MASLPLVPSIGGGYMEFAEIFNYGVKITLYVAMLAADVKATSHGNLCF